MRAMCRVLVASLLLVGWNSGAFAQGLTTMTVLDSTGATKTYRMVQDASSRLSNTMSVCDPTIGANATTNCATVTAGILQVSLGSGGATAANQSTEITSLATIATNTGAAIPAGTATIGTVGQLPYPVGSTPYTASATGTTAATTATLTGASSVTTYICGFSIRANANAAATGNATVTGTITGTLNFTQWTAPNASGLGVTEMIFSPCVPASGTNQSVAVVSAAPGTGGVVSATAWGYKL